MSFLSRAELEALPFASLGQEVYISSKASLYGVEYMHIGNRVRIDDFCLLSVGPEGLYIGDWVHVSAYALLVGRARITLGDFVNIGARTAVYTNSDDFSGASLTNPLVHEAYKQVTYAPVTLEKHALVATQCTLLPGVVMQEGAALGAHSLAKGELERFWIYGGVPARKLKPRKEDLLALEKQLRGEQK